MDTGETEEDLGEEGQRDTGPVVVMPFVLILSDRLRKAASDAGFQMWFTYLGKVYDMFSQHRGKSHASKTRNSVYQRYCNCGIGYIRESTCNLKVRVAEHLHTSSSSALKWIAI